MVPWLRPRHSAITFDLGAAGIRACQFQRAGAGRGHGLKLCDSLQLDRTPQAELDRLAAPAFDPALLDRLIGQGSFRGRNVALVLSPPEVQFFPLRLPLPALDQPRPLVEQALRWEVAQQSRKSADELEVRYWTLPPGRGQQANVMAVVMPAASAGQWCDLLRPHRITLRRIDVSPCALTRLALQAFTPTEQDLWGVLDLGLRHSVLTAVVGSTPTYVRALSVSAHDWTLQLAAAFEISYSVAEQLKRQHGAHSVGRGVSTGPRARNLLEAADLPSAVSSVLRDALQNLAQEIGRCFSYVLQSFPDVSLKRVWLAGGGARFVGLPPVLEARLEVPVRVLAGDGQARDEPWERPLNNASFPSHAAACAGGAILDLEAA